MKRYRLAIIEQSAVITEGLRALLRGDNDFEVGSPNASASWNPTL